MNSYINAQILNMVTMTKTFEQACELAAIKDDGILSREEEKQLKKIKAATQRFRKEIESINKDRR
jgi:hypothetical protein